MSNKSVRIKWYKSLADRVGAKCLYRAFFVSTFIYLISLDNNPSCIICTDFINRHYCGGLKKDTLQNNPCKIPQNVLWIEYI